MSKVLRLSFRDSGELLIGSGMLFQGLRAATENARLVGCRSCGECQDCSVNVDAEIKVYKQEHANIRGHIDLLDDRTLYVIPHHNHFTAFFSGPPG